MKRMRAAAEPPIGPGACQPAGPPVSRRTLLLAALASLVLGSSLLAEQHAGRSASTPAVARQSRSAAGLSSLPLAARGVASAALGAANPAYRVSGSARETTAYNPAQRLGMRFSPAGVDVRGQAGTVGVSLHAIGYGNRVAPVSSAQPRAHSNRVVYEHRGVSEWYANGPLGLEQGFVVARPSGAGSQVTLSMRLSGDTEPVLADSGHSVTLARRGASQLRYSDLLATDARGRGLPTRMTLHGTQLLLSVDARAASYPLRIDPLVQQGPKLVANDQSGEGGVGESVALSADGNTALVGGPYDSGKPGSGSGVGAAWVFTRSGSTWTQQGPKLLGLEENGEGDFGTSVALSADGNTALIGGTTDHANEGAAWVFTRSGSKWTQQGPKLTGADGISYFGKAVALSADGNTALVGGDLNNAVVGAAWVFVRSGSTWTLQGGKLTASDESGQGFFGSSVALSADGNTALIGGEDDDNKGFGGPGAAWAFTRSGSTWTQQGTKLTGGEEVGPAGFGRSVALSEDGNTALIGGLADNKSMGAAWVFIRSGVAWSQQGPKLTGAGEIGPGGFGASVALSADGNTALVGAEQDNKVTGAAWLFTRGPFSWSQQGSKLTGSGEVEEDGFGDSVALSSDASTALVGARGDNEFIGAAFVFALPAPPSPPPTPSPGPPSTTPPTVTSRPPTVTGLAQSRRVWRERKQQASFARARKLAPVGTTLTFTLDQQAAVSFGFRRLVTGRRVHSRCVAQTRRNRTAKSCTREVPAGQLGLTGHSGRNSVKFFGWTSRSSHLAPGRYTLVVTATSSTGLRSAPASLSFTIAG